MTAVKYDSVIDAMWEQWTKGFNNLLENNKQMENWTLKALDQQKEFVNKAMEQVQHVDQQWKQEVEQLQTKVTENLRKTAGNVVADSYEEWSNRVHEAMQKLQQVSVDQNKASCNFVQQAHEQYQQAISQLLEEQQKAREEFQNVSDAYIEQLKGFQKSFLQSVEQYSLVK
ncbi:polyhydroxyalkanoic acid inclusion protein PhaP [Bacillus songklensis]|uniref:Polyhydroxyalkanoic acid inclusion protein PhaP n=1 Tax=Bacillus songklensis TaxID=1069116 RepID=A0ABV8B292_9BACI